MVCLRLWPPMASLRAPSFVASGTLTTNDVNGVTNSYLSDRNKAPKKKCLFYNLFRSQYQNGYFIIFSEVNPFQKFIYFEHSSIECRAALLWEVAKKSPCQDSWFWPSVGSNFKKNFCSAGAREHAWSMIIKQIFSPMHTVGSTVTESKKQLTQVRSGQKLQCPGTTVGW